MTRSTARDRFTAKTPRPPRGGASHLVHPWRLGGEIAFALSGESTHQRDPSFYFLDDPLAGVVLPGHREQSGRPCFNASASVIFVIFLNSD